MFKRIAPNRVYNIKEGYHVWIRGKGILAYSDERIHAEVYFEPLDAKFFPIYRDGLTITTVEGENIELDDERKAEVLNRIKFGAKALDPRSRVLLTSYGEKYWEQPQDQD